MVVIPVSPETCVGAACPPRFPSQRRPLSPQAQRFRAFQGEAMVAGGDSGCRRGRRRSGGRLPPSPLPGRAVAGHREALEAAGRDSPTPEARGPGRAGAIDARAVAELAFQVLAPTPDRAVAGEGEGEARRDGDDAGESVIDRRWRRGDGPTPNWPCVAPRSTRVGRMRRRCGSAGGEGPDTERGVGAAAPRQQERGQNDRLACTTQEDCRRIGYGVVQALRSLSETVAGW
jgi:hypothetical protein